jgi:hypothetical protein
MGWFSDLFGKGSGQEGPTVDRAVARLQKKLMNKYVNTVERKRVIQLLGNIGSQEAVTALLGRFTYVTDGSIVDEDEKTLVYEMVRGMGEDALPALTAFIRTEAAVYWPLRALTEIAGEEKAVDVVLETLDGIRDRFSQSMERMNSLVSSLRDYPQPRVMKRLIDLAQDETEEIRFLAVDGLSMFDKEQEAVDAIVQRLLVDDETTRVKTYVMDMLLERKWKVKRFKKELAGKIPESYFVDDTGVVQRK